VSARNSMSCEIVKTCSAPESQAITMRLAVSFLPGQREGGSRTKFGAFVAAIENSTDPSSLPKLRLLSARKPRKNARQPRTYAGGFRGNSGQPSVNPGR
jgi:hypothetical protein